MSHTQNDNSDHHNAQVISRLVNCIVVLICIIVLLIVINITGLPSLRSENNDEEIYREELVKVAFGSLESSRHNINSERLRS